MSPVLGPAAQISKERLGARTKVVSQAITVTTALTELLAANPNRLSWQVMNRSVNNGAVSHRPDATFANGTLLGAGGGVASMNVDEDGDAVAARVYAINDVANGVWDVTEILVTDWEERG